MAEQTLERVRSDLGIRKAAKELKVEELRKTRLDVSERRERIGDPSDVFVVAHSRFEAVGIERREVKSSAALLGTAVPNVVDDKSAHRPGSVRDEVRAIREAGGIALAKAQESLMQQRGALSDPLPLRRSSNRPSRCNSA